MRTRAQVESIARAAGFRFETVERVLRLLGILSHLDTHELSTGKWLLKGGTALNLLHLKVPRLSVDIDINYVAELTVEELVGARKQFEQVLISCSEREGCSVKRAPTEHAGGKFRLRFSSILGGTQNLEVDVNYVARVPLLGSERRKTLFPPGEELIVPSYSLEEIAAGKFTALLTRHAARDYFDSLSILDLDPGLLEQPSFRVAFMVQVAGSRVDFRVIPSTSHPLEVQEVRTMLIPVLRVVQGEPPHDPAALSERLTNGVADLSRRLTQWSAGERRFLDRLIDHAEIEPEHVTPDAWLQERIRKQPMLLWKQRNVRKHLGFGDEHGTREE